MKVAVLDRAAFPRDKVCAGWITPQVVEDLELDLGDYSSSRRLQTFTGFRVGLIGQSRDTRTSYERPISFGIRRCEFDQYLLERSGATLRLGTAISSIRQDERVWIVDEDLRAPLLVGAGGHFCPVARQLNGSARPPQVVAAQEAEFPLDAVDARGLRAVPEEPELYFSRDLKGYGWCVRKREYLNVGFGHVSDRALPEASAEFVTFLKSRGRIPPGMTWRWKGHAYLLADPPHRTLVDRGVMLVGDAAGLAYSQSGEGIRPAIESAMMAASIIVNACGDYSKEALEPYQAAVRERFGRSAWSRAISRTVTERVGPRLSPWLFGQPWFVRRVVLDEGFLHREVPAIPPAGLRAEAPALESPTAAVPDRPA